MSTQTPVSQMPHPHPPQGQAGRKPVDTSPWRVASPELTWVTCLVSCQTHRSLSTQELLSLLPSHLPDGDTEAREDTGLSRIPQPETGFVIAHCPFPCPAGMVEDTGSVHPRQSQHCASREGTASCLWLLKFKSINIKITDSASLSHQPRRRLGGCHSGQAESPTKRQ